MNEQAARRTVEENRHRISPREAEEADEIFQILTSVGDTRSVNNLTESSLDSNALQNTNILKSTSLPLSSITTSRTNGVINKTNALSSATTTSQTHQCSFETAPPNSRQNKSQIGSYAIDLSPTFNALTEQLDFATDFLKSSTNITDKQQSAKLIHLTVQALNSIRRYGNTD